MTFMSQFSCAPTLEVSKIEAPKSWLFEPPEEYSSMDISQNWWEVFGDTTLNRLVERALTNNRDLIAAISRVESSRAEIKIARGEYLPSLSMGVTGDAERYKWEGRYKYLYIAPTVSWELPLFGALRSTNQQSRATAMASEWALRGVELSITSEVATNYFNLRCAEANYEIASKSCELRRKEAALIDSMARYGMSNGVDLNQARSLVYSAEADITAYRRESDILNLSLALLLGEMPRQNIVAKQSVAELLASSIPIKLPAMLPSALLERRWDVQQSQQQSTAAAAAVGLARAARFPSFTLSASGGVASETLKNLTSGDPWAWSVVGTLAEPIFNFGSLKSKEAAARSEYRATLMEYEQTMLQAISEVEQAMLSFTSYATERVSNEQEVAAERAVRHAVGALYANGMEDYLNVIDAERTLYASEQSLIESITSQMIGYITLCKALGGGY